MPITYINMIVKCSVNLSVSYINGSTINILVYIIYFNNSFYKKKMYHKDTY